MNTAATDLTQVLDELRNAVVQSNDYDDRTKRKVAADIDTIQGQIQKPVPDKGILTRAWEGVKNAVSVGEAVELAVKAGTLIASIAT